MNIEATNPQPTNTESAEAIVRTGWVTRMRQRIFHRRVLMVIGLGIALALFVAWLTPQTRIALAAGLFQNRTLLLLLVLFLLVSFSLLWSAGQNMDAWVFIFFNVRGKHPRWLDGAMWLLTQVGNMGVAGVAAAILYILNFSRLAIEIVLGLLSLWLVVETVKAITDRARPFALLKDVRVIGWRAIGRSFPSGHTAQAFFMMSLFVHELPLIGWAAVALYLLAGLVGFTRMYVGAHYPRDVLAGALIGLVWAFFIMATGTYLYPG